MKHRGMKILSLLLTLALVLGLGLMPGMSLTAYAATYESGSSVIISALTAEDILKSGVTVTTANSKGFRVYINTEAVISNYVQSYTTDKNYSVIAAMEAAHDDWIIDLQPIAHTHSFTYGASGSTITATCNGEGTCDITEGLTLTISAPTGNLVYDGTTTYPAVLSTGYNTTAFPGTYSISYTKDGSAYSGVPKDAGTYTASVTAGEGNGAATASVSYTITAPQPTTYTVSVAANGGDGTMADVTDVSGEYTLPGCGFDPPEGQSFKAWRMDGTSNEFAPGAKIIIGRNTTFVAVWQAAASGSTGFDFGGGDGWNGGYVTGLRAYRVSLAPMQGGSAALVLNTGESGETMNVYPQTTVRVVPSPAPGYKLASIVWSLIDGSASYDITQSQNFVMPAMDAVVHVTFVPVG